jgi:N-acetylglucosaminyl-diphospho-decaprenol L-rhamnosyltransferase
MDLSIVIVSWNVAGLLADCLHSIVAHPPAGEYEVWVVDNASQDDSVRMLREQFPEAHLIINEINVGFATANNQAIEAARGRYVLLLNPDTVVYPGTFQEMIDFLDQNPQAGAVGSLYESPDGSLQPSCFPYPTLSRELWRLLHLDRLVSYGIYPMQRWSKDTPRQVDSLQGASLMLRRSALEKTGLLDPNYFMYTEEIDLCYRLHLQGWSLYWVPQSRITHFGGQSTRQTALKMFLCLYSSKVQFFRKHYGARSAYNYKRVLWLVSILRRFLAMLGSLIRPQDRQHYRQVSENYQALIAGLPTM